ncbi:MAG: hypothetical protein JKY50_05935 [Oleispira sp.]|nr:hypothetical protein [Oleispira sp.]MBL4880542.1 hypothetical protein [Oleispira sp.]
MTIIQAVSIGGVGNEISKKITGSDEVSTERTAVATVAGGLGGAVVSGVLIVTSVAAAPVVVPLAAAAATVSFLMSRFS